MKFHAIALGAAALALTALGPAQAQQRSPAQLPRIQAAPSAPRIANPQQAATFGLPRAAGLTSPFPAGLTAGNGPATGAAVTTTSTGKASTSVARAVSPLAGNVLLQNPNVTQDVAATAAPSVPDMNNGVGGQVIGGGVAAAPVAPGAYAATAVMGAGTNMPSAPQSVALGSGPYTPVETARSFLYADANADGELTRAEATRLAIMPFSFEEMDRNHDGVVRRSEYDDSLH